MSTRGMEEESPSVDRWGENTGRAVLDAFYTNADRMEDVEAHRPMGDGGATYLED